MKLQATIALCFLGLLRAAAGTFNVSTLDQFDEAIAIASHRDVILITQSITLKTGPYRMPPGVNLVGAADAEGRKPTLRMNGRLNLRSNACVLELVPSPWPARISGIHMEMEWVPGVLSGPLGRAAAGWAVFPAPIHITGVSISAMSDALYFANCAAKVYVEDSVFQSAFDLIYSNGDVTWSFSGCQFFWTPDPVRSGNVCVSWGFVGGSSSMEAQRCTFTFRNASAQRQQLGGLTYLSTGDVTLTDARFHNPDNLPIVAILGISGVRTGKFSIR